MVELFEQNIRTSSRQSSKGNQLKWENEGTFGVNEDPDYNDYKEFLESRCFPRTRDKMKLVLEDMGLPFYDTFMIIEKTQGRMAEDNFWLKIEK